MNYWNAHLPRKLSHYKYKNLTFLFLSLITAFTLSRFEAFHQFLLGLGQFEYVSAFIGGFLFVSTFTVATGALILLVLAENLDVFWLGLAAGCGALLGDFVIFRFVRDNVAGEVERLYDEFGGRHLTHLLHTRYFHWTLPVIGALIIASPLPDEIGVSLLGISKMKTHHFIALSFILNTVGIITVLILSNFIKP